jgi:acyl carrier protein
MIAPIGTQVRRILADTLSVPAEQITNTTSPETIETWDSLQHLNFVLAMEQAFNINFKPEEIEQLTSFRVIVEMLEMKLGTRS